MHHFTTSIAATALLACLLLGCDATPSTRQGSVQQGAEYVPGMTPVKKVDLNALAAEFRDLRKQTSHYKQGGEFNHNVDPYGSRMHQVMEELEARLTPAPPTIADLTALLGEPDAKETREGLLVLLYYWRGRHDYLYFVTDGKKVTAIRWYFAYE